jgi:hypothetical protein
MKLASVNLNKRRTLVTLATLGAAGVIAPLVSGSTTIHLKLVPPSRPVDLRYFGMHIQRLAVRQPWYPYSNSLTEWPAVQFGVLRPAYANWHNLQPKPGRWNFSELDRYVSLAEQHNAEVMLPLCSPPQWASARPNEQSPWGHAAPGGAAEPTLIEDWRNYVRTVATRYKGRIRQYEFWNEPNARGSRPFFTGTVNKAVELTREAYQTLKEVDAANTLAGPAGTGGGFELTWVDEYLQKGAKDCLDKLSYHFYVANDRPESMIQYVDKVKSLAQKHGLSHLPLLNTETGWVIANTQSESSYVGADPAWTTLQPDLAAAYVARALIVGWALGLEGYHWFCWDHNSMGLIEPATKQMKPAGLAYGKTVEWLLGSTMTACESSQGVWTCTFQAQSGGVFHIVWRESGNPEGWVPPSAWGSHEWGSLDGVMNQTKTTAILLGQKPVLIR